MKKTIITIASLLLMTSCASVVHGTTQQIKIKSNDNQKIVVMDSYGNKVKEGNGELLVKLKRGEGAFKGASYTVISGNKKAYIEPTVNVGAFGVGNFFVPTFLGYIIDGVNGAMWDLNSNGHSANMIDFTN